ncbi:MAG: hypothetical protein WC915_02735 [archaeon]|jgi:hypothetical protein
MDLKNTRLIIVAMIVVAIISFAIGITITGTPAVGAVPVYSGSGDDWTPSSTDTIPGITIDADANTVCFPGASACDINIVWNGTDMIING